MTTTADLTTQLGHETPVHCGNCEWAGTALDLKREIADIGERIAPGEVVPAGECPVCQALAYVVSETSRGSAYRRLRTLVMEDNPAERDLNERLLGFARTHTTRAMALMAAYHDSPEEGLPQTRFDAVHAFLFAAVLCSCEKEVKITGMDGLMAFDRLADVQKDALHELLNVADDMICTTLDAVAIDVPEGLEEAVLNPNMTKQ